MKSKHFTPISNLWEHQGKQSNPPMISGEGHFFIIFLKESRIHISRYAFVEFGSSDECKAARGKLATTQFKGKELIVDFVGEVNFFLLGTINQMDHFQPRITQASKNKSQKVKSEDKAPSRLNPTRLTFFNPHKSTLCNLKYHQISFHTGCLYVA